MQMVVLRTSLEERFSIRRRFRSCQIAYTWPRDAYTVYSRANVGTGNSPCGFDAANRAASICLISGQADRYVLSSEENRAALRPNEDRRFGKRLSVTVMDIERWLSLLGLEQYARTFADNDVDFAMLPRLTDADLKELGVHSLGHRKRMLFSISELATAASCATPSVVDVQADERRQVTILFADLCGFTALSQALDPEELHDVIGRYTALVDGIVLAYGGTIDKHIGDAVMALFGAPRAHDTDTLRAARAALDIHDALTRLGAQASRPLQAHVGIASGEVVAGAVGRADAQDYTVHGDPVNLAARLVTAAKASETLISDGVQRALGDYAVCEPAGDMRFKGIDTP